MHKATAHEIVASRNMLVSLHCLFLDIVDPAEASINFSRQVVYSYIESGQCEDFRVPRWCQALSTYSQGNPSFGRFFQALLIC